MTTAFVLGGIIVAERGPHVTAIAAFGDRGDDFCVALVLFSRGLCPFDAAHGCPDLTVTERRLWRPMIGAEGCDRYCWWNTWSRTELLRRMRGSRNTLLVASGNSRRFAHERGSLRPTCRLGIGEP